MKACCIDDEDIVKDRKVQRVMIFCFEKFKIMNNILQTMFFR